VRWKVLILFGIMFVCLTLVSGAALRRIVLTSFAAHEEADLRRDVAQVLHVLTKAQEELKAEAGAWAVRDEFRTFVAGGTAASGRANVNGAVLARLEIDLVACVDTSRRLVFARAFDRDGSEVPFPEEFKEWLLRSDVLLRRAAAGKGAAGIVPLRGTTWLVAAQPVLADEGEGSVRGTLVIGRRLAVNKIKHPGAENGLVMSVRRWDDPALPPDFRRAKSALEAGNQRIFTRALDPRTISGYALLEDLGGAPALILRVDSPRVVYRHGQVALFFLLAFSVSATLAFILATLFALERMVLSRLARLSKEVGDIGARGDLAARVSVQGDDELAGLAQEINGMLAGLEHSKQIKEREERYRRLFDEALTGNYITGPDGTILLCNPAFARIFGFPSVAHAAGANLFSFFPSVEEKEEFLRLVRQHGRLELRESKRLRRDGREIWVVENAGGDFDAGGELVRLQGYLFEITKRKEAEEALARSSRQTQLILAAVGEGICGVDLEGNTTFANPAASQMTGYQVSELVGRPQHDLIHYAQADGSAYPPAGCPIYATLRDGVTRRISGEVFWRKDGTPFPVEYVCTPVREQGMITGAVVVFRDITERQQAEEALREAHTRIRQLLASIASILIGVGPDDRVIQWNLPAEEAFGVPAAAVLGRPLAELALRWDWPKVAAGIARCQEKGTAVRVDDVRYERPDGTNGFLGFTITPVMSNGTERLGYVLLGADITGRKEAEAQALLRQKLESIGQLAAGIAHEINTPMQYIGDNTTFLRDAFGEVCDFLGRCQELVAGRAGGTVPVEALATALAVMDVEFLQAEIPKAIEQSLEGISRVRKLVLAMKDFAHPGKKEKTPCDINKAVESTVTISRNEWKYVADVVLDLQPDLPLVHCLKDEINQVILNIIVNAAHAVADGVNREAGEKGTITIQTRSEDDHVKISISDTGTGIPEEIIHRIFDPFFTTKEVGRGTGQGLTIAHDIVVNKHGGRITVDSEVGKGSTFTV
ncbi:MAG: PAS domain S-box protein, partial [Thermoanaerobacteraceae bacterium]|nr:PAS domain S-box protein [Thermoanaerobacteraceae bacterium]